MGVKLYLIGVITIQLTAYIRIFICVYLCPSVVKKVLFDRTQQGTYTFE